MPKISLLLYIHNAQGLLPQCLNSLLKQREKDFELLISDNASTDGTFSILETYQKKDERIKVFHCTEEENVAAIKNNLLQKAKGEIITFLPLAVFKEDYLQYAWRKINAGKYDALILRTDKEFMTFPRCKDGVYSLRDDKTKLFFCNLPVAENIFYRQQFLKKIKAKFCDAEFGADFAFYIKTIAEAEKVCYVNKNLLKAKAYFCEFNNRELANYQQFSEIVKAGAKALQRCNLWESSEKYYIEALYNYLQIMLERLPYPVKNFFKKFIVETIIKEVNSAKFDRKMYTLPIVADWFYQLKLKTYPSEEFEKCFYSERDNITPIVLAAESDKNATLTDVLLQSIIANANSHKFYDVYILTRGDISKHIKETIEKEATKNFCINFVDVTKFISDNAYTYLYRTSSLYFFIPDILPFYKHVVYLKNNVTVLKDIALFNTLDMKDNLIAAAKEYADNEYIETKLNLISETYVDESVLLFNIQLCKKINLSQKFLHEISSESKIYQAQDIINTLCFDKISVIAPEFNCKADILSGKRLIKDYPYKLDGVVVLNYENNPPHLNYAREFADIWWKNARRSMFYEFINMPQKYVVSNREYNLMLRYIKETFLKIFTYGKKAKKHKENMEKLQTLVTEERSL